MATNNDVFSIIPIQNNNAIIAAGSPKSALAVNQVGVFDYDTGLSINAAGAGAVRNFFIAMAVDRDGDTVVDDFIEIAGTHIQKRNVTGYSTRCYTPGRPQIIDIQNFKAECDTTYAFKVQLDNDEKYANFGYNQAAKTFTAKSKCCENCGGCGSGDCISLVADFVTQVNNDPDGLLLASVFANIALWTVTVAPTADATLTVTIGATVISVAVLNADSVDDVATKIAAAVAAITGYTASAIGAVVYVSTTNGANLTVPITVVFAAGGTGVALTVADIQSITFSDFVTFQIQYPSTCPTLRLTSVPSKVKSYCCLNTQYFHLRMPHLIVSFVRGNTHAIGFECNGEIVTVQDLVYPEGAGYDMAQIEYQAFGFQGSPYRVGNLSEGDFLPGSLVNKTGTYNKVDITYDQESVAGWLEHKNNLNTSIIIPCGNTVFTVSLMAVLDALLTVFDAKADDLAACNCNLNLTQNKAAAVDGLG